MSRQVQSADGVIHQFPDATPQAVIDRVMQDYVKAPQAPAAPAPKAAPKAAPPRSVAENVSGFMANLNAKIPFGDEFQAATRTAGDLFTGQLRSSAAPRPRGPNGLPSPADVRGAVVDDFKANLADNRRLESRFSDEHPIIAGQAKGMGLASSMLVPAGKGVELLSNGSRLGNAARGAVTAGAVAAGYAAADKGTVRERLTAASNAASDPVTLGLGAAAAPVAAAVSKYAGKAVDAVRNRLTTKYAPEVVQMVKNDVQLTPGQARGGVAKALEDTGTSLPLAGTAISEARRAGVETYNRAKLNSALGHIGEHLPDDVPAGTAGVKHVGDTLSAAYTKLIPEGGVHADPEFAQGVKQISPLAETLTAPNQKRLQDILQLRVIDRFNTDGGILSGAMYQRVDRELTSEINRFGKSPDPDHNAMAEALTTVQGALRDAAARQNPAFAASKTAIDKGWAELVRIEDAAKRAVNEGGVFTPAQMTGAMSKADTRVRGRGVARGESLNQDFDVAAQRVLPSKTGDSGTPARAMAGLIVGLPGSVVGAGVAGAPGVVGGAAATLATLKLVASRYSPEALEAFNTALSAKVSAQEAAPALARLKELAAKDPSLKPVYEAAAARLTRSVGAVSESARSNDQPRRLTSSTRSQGRK